MDPRYDTSENRLQIGLAKVRMTAPERAAMTDLLAVTTDWEAALATADRNFSLPNMRLHLREMAPGLIDAQMQTRLDQAANRTAIRNLTLVAAQRRFQETCLAPLGVQGLFFKGINLVARYYPDLGLRPCRDIDILVPKAALRDIVHHALTQEYRLVAPGQPPKFLSAPEEIKAALHYRSDAMLISPEGAAIDLQVKLDKFSGIFDPDAAFAQAEEMELGGARFPTMPAPYLFNYICHHHSRHVWSHLHWLSDLDAMVGFEGFDPDAALALADRLGQRGTVEAALELQRLMSPLADWTPHDDNWRGLKFLELTLRNLGGDLALEKQVAFEMVGGEFMYPWQARPDLIRKARRGQWRDVLRPTLKQYVDHPLPRGLRWLYVFPRLQELLRKTRERRAH